MEIRENEVYLWEEGNAILGFCKANINGIEEEFGAGFEIANKDGKKAKHALARNRAMRQVKIQFANVFDALKLYGDRILDVNGNIDHRKFMELELAIQRKKEKEGKIDLNEKENFMKLKDLVVNHITLEQANALRISDNL